MDTDGQLPPTPVSGDGSPLVGVPEGPLDPEQVRRRLAAEGTPLLGPRRTVEGVRMITSTFVMDLPPQRADELAMVHIASLTDNHRTHVSPAFLTPLAGDPTLRTLTYLLPADGIYSYRLVLLPDIADDIGSTREGWIHIHQNGISDPYNLHETLPDPFGERSSVWIGPDAPSHPDWRDDRPESAHWTPMTHIDPLGRDRELCWTRIADSPGAQPPLLILFDGQTWFDLPLIAALEARGRPLDVVLVGSGDFELRSADLPDGERATQLVEFILETVPHTMGRPPTTPSQVALCGQSFGGLAAANAAVRRPDLVGNAIIQSGSFWWPDRPGAPTVTHAPDGLLSSQLEQGWWPPDPASRLILQVGTDEGVMVPLARSFRDHARAAGWSVDYQEVRGGHDYAWWRLGLTAALDQLGW